MVLFSNITIGQIVEVRHENHIHCGTVRYKGHLNGVSGEWVGLELNYPVGSHNSCWRGRHYFKCRANCGLFTHACNIRFLSRNRHSKNTYRKVDDTSSVDETLFFRQDESRSNSCYSVSNNYAEHAKTGFQMIENKPSLFTKEPRYSLPHSVGRAIPAATMLKPSYCQVTYQSQPTYQFNSYDEEFISKPTIPHYTMPHQALKRQVKRGGWEEYGVRKPRFMSV